MTELREFEVEEGVFETETTIDNGAFGTRTIRFETCLLYTSDAADE